MYTHITYIYVWCLDIFCLRLHKLEELMDDFQVKVECEKLRNSYS